MLTGVISYYFNNSLSRYTLVVPHIMHFPAFSFSLFFRCGILILAAAAFLELEPASARTRVVAANGLHERDPCPALSFSFPLSAP